MKRMFIAFIVMVILISASMPAFAMDKRVSASKGYNYSKVITASEAAKHSGWKKGYYKGGAKGYVTSKKYHYVNMEFVVMMQHVKYSGRVYGKGQIWADTGYAKSVSSISPASFSWNLYYGFE